MAVVIEMPKLSDTMEEGQIASWLKSEGDFVEEGEPLIEVETDKATMEYGSPEEGHLLKIVVPAGGSAPLNAPIAVLGEKGEGFDLEKLTGGGGTASAPAPAEKTVEAPAERAAPAATAPAPAASGGRIKASPLAKKMAQERGVDIAALAGSGPHGRVIARDVKGAGATAGQPAVVASAPSMGGSVVPHTKMRATIAKRLLAAKNDAPHFYLTVSADCSRMLAWRADLNKDPGVETGKLAKVSVNDCILMAASRALLRHPLVNASWRDDGIEYHDSVDMAVAVALPEGLITPIVRGADRLGVREIAGKSKELIVKAKGGGLAPSDYQGGTFTVSNLGMAGIEEFTAIINPPQSCILAVGATRKVPVVGDDDRIIVQPRMKMTLSCDHRVVDGLVGAQFLQSLVAFIEDPRNMLA